MKTPLCIVYGVILPAHWWLGFSFSSLDYLTRSSKSVRCILSPGHFCVLLGKGEPFCAHPVTIWCHHIDDLDPYSWVPWWEDRVLLILPCLPHRDRFPMDIRLDTQRDGHTHATVSPAHSSYLWHSHQDTAIWGYCWAGLGPSTGLASLCRHGRSRSRCRLCGSEWCCSHGPENQRNILRMWLTAAAQRTCLSEGKMKRFVISPQL